MISSVIGSIIALFICYPDRSLLDHVIGGMPFHLGESDAVDAFCCCMGMVEVPEIPILVKGPRAFGGAPLGDEGVDIGCFGLQGLAVRAHVDCSILSDGQDSSCQLHPGGGCGQAK